MSSQATLLKLDEEEIVPIEQTNTIHQNLRTKNNDSCSTESWSEKKQHFRCLPLGYAALILFLLSIFVYLSFMSHGSSNQASQSFITSTNKLPKIMWIYTRGEILSQQANTIIYYYHLNQTASKLGYQVREVNSWTAYSWLSSNITASITKTIQNNLIDQTVDSLLKLALLIEHGGIMIGNLGTVINTDLKWLEGMFNVKIDPQKYMCPFPQIFMVDFKDRRFVIKFYQNFIAAIPESVLLKEAFNVLSDVLITGSFPKNDELQVMQHRNYTNVDFLPYSIENVVSYVVYKYIKSTWFSYKGQENLCKKFGIQKSFSQYVINLNDYPKKERPEFLFKSKRRPKADLIINANTTTVNQALSRLIMEPDAMNFLDSKSVMSMVLKANGNKEVFYDPPPNRKDVELCIIVVDEMNKKEMAETISTIRDQEGVRWSLVMFTNSSNLENNSSGISILKSSGNQIRNIEVAVTQFCHQKSYALLLHKGDRFNSVITLSQISRALEPRWIVGAAISLEFKGTFLKATENHIKFSRAQDGIVNPKMDLMEEILNHFRVFSVEAFRYIPQFDHVDIFGNYFEDRMIFLMTLLQMINSPREEYRYVYLCLKYYNQFNVPKTAIVIDEDIRIITNVFDSINKEQLKKTHARFDAEPIGNTMDEIFHFDVPFTKLLVFNPGHEFVSVDKKQGSDKIPKVIHQIWLGGKMGIAQEYFYNKAKKIYPDYEMKLWSEEDITAENFPLTLDIIKNLIDFHRNRKSAFHKLATVTDIMRHQILYHQGGFWRDAGMNFFRPILNKFLKYDLVIGAERSLRHRWNQGMCFFGNIPKSPHMWRITSHPNVNRMRIYNDIALDIAGPFDFRNIVRGYQQYSSEVLMMNFEFFYPGQVGRPPLNDLCTRYEKEYEGQPYQFKHNGCYLLTNCDKKYPYAYGLDHNCFGVSWMKRVDSS